MNARLAEVVAELGLEPGQSYVDDVGDREVEVRVRWKPADTPPPVNALPTAAEPVEERSEFEAMVMLVPWFDSPESPGRVLIKPVRHIPDFPAPFTIDDSDLAPE